MLAEVGHCHEVARVSGRSVLIGHPNLHAVNLNARGNRGQLRHVGVVFVTEIVGEEKVSVFVVGICRKLIIGELHTALGTDALRTGLLLGNDRADLKFAELHVGANAEERRCAANERRVGGHGDVARLDELDDFVFLAFVAQLEVLCVEVEGGFGVIVKVEVHLVAHLAVDAEIYLLVEIKAEYLAVALRERGVVGEARVRADFQFGGALCLDAHAARTEDLIRRPEVKLHVGEVELLFALCLEVVAVLRAIVFRHGAAETPIHIFLARHEKRRFEIVVAEFCAEAVGIFLFVVLCFCLQVLGVFEVDACLRFVFVLNGGALHLEARGHRVGRRGGDTRLSPMHGKSGTRRIRPQHCRHRRSQHQGNK